MIQQVMMWKVEDCFFETEEEAKQWADERAFEKAVEQIVNTFYYRDLDEDDIVKGIIQNKDKLLEVLIK